MADEQTVATQEPSLADFKKARNEGVPIPEPEPVEKEAEELEKEQPEEKTEEKPRQKGWNGAQKKIDRLVKHNAELETAREADRKRIEELEKGVKKEEPKPKADDEPKLEDFTDEHLYLKALAKWEVKQEMKAEREAQEREAEQAETRAIFDAHNQKISAARAKYDDFDETVNESVKTPWQSNSRADVIASQAFQVGLIESENGGELIYYLGKHPEELDKLAGLSPARIQMAIGRIADKLEEQEEESEETEGEEPAEEEEEKPRKKLPTPITPVGKGSARTSRSLADLPLSEFKKARQAGRIS